MVPQCVERESEINAPGKKKKVDQTQLLELTVDYIQQLKDAMAELQKENQFLKSYIDKNSPNSSPGSYSGSSPPKCIVSPNSSPFNHMQSPNSSNFDCSAPLDVDLQILTNEIQNNQQNMQKHHAIPPNYYNARPNASTSPPKPNPMPMNAHSSNLHKQLMNQQPIQNGTYPNLPTIQKTNYGHPTALPLTNPALGMNGSSNNFTNSFPIALPTRSIPPNPLFAAQNHSFNQFSYQQQPVHAKGMPQHPINSLSHSRGNQPLIHSQNSMNAQQTMNNGPAGSYLKKRNINEVYNHSEIDYELNATKQPKYLNTARILMAVFVVGLIFYNPISYPQNPSAELMNSFHYSGRTLQGMENSVFLQSPAVSTNWFFFLFMAASAKICMLIFWTFGALLLDHFFVPPSDCVQYAKKENDLGIQLYDEGDYHAAKRHFSKALQHLGRSASPNVLQRLFHIPLELCRQVLHLLRIGLWCDGYLVHLRGGAPAMLEIARANHYLFSLNMLSNTIDSHSVLYFLVSLNAAESLYQKPPVLAEVYATIAIAFYGLLSMPKAYHHLMNKAWAIVNTCQEEDKKKDSVDNTIAYLLLLSSYGTLCSGNLIQVQTQIQHACELFEKKGNMNMFFQGQFVMAYTHFLRGDCQTAVQLITAVDVSKLRDDPRISWWRALVLIGCQVSFSLFSSSLSFLSSPPSSPSSSSPLLSSPPFLPCPLLPSPSFVLSLPLFYCSFLLASFFYHQVRQKRNRGRIEGHLRRKLYFFINT